MLKYKPRDWHEFADPQIGVFLCAVMKAKTYKIYREQELYFDLHPNANLFSTLTLVFPESGASVSVVGVCVADSLCFTSS